MQSLPKQQKQQEKTATEVMSEDRKSELVAQFTDDVLSKLTGAFFDVCAIERWTKRDLSQISGMNETAIGHILAGRRKNLTVETIALLARAMKVRPELVMHDTRATGNHMPQAERQNDAALSLAARPAPHRTARALSSAFDPTQRIIQSSALQKGPASAERLAYAQPEFEKEVSQ
jgi:transcriptional regulator with XRE-family HTH domain